MKATVAVAASGSRNAPAETDDVKRLHDMALPAPLVLCLFVPAISLFALIAFMVWPGTQGPNVHGPVPDRPKD